MRSIVAALSGIVAFRLRTLLLFITMFGVVLLPAWQRISENRRSRALQQRFSMASLSGRAPPDTPRAGRHLPAFMSREFWPRHGDGLTGIDASGIRQTFTDDDLKDLHLFRHLRELRIPGSPITEKGAEYIVPLRELKVLDLSGSKITDAGLKKIATIKSLESLDLVGTAITDDGLVCLLAMPNLSGLSVARTRITDRAAALLGRMPGLKGLNVTETRFTLAGGTVLRKLLPNVEVWPVDITPPKPGVVRIRAY